MGKESWKPGNMLYPVPVVMVSTLDEQDKPNIITLAWAGTICSDPAMVSISVRPSRYSHGALVKNKEFVINLVSRNITRAADLCGVKSGRDVDKFKDCKLTPMPSKYVKAPGIEESPVNIECKVKDIIPLGTHDMFIAEVLGVTVDDAFMAPNGRFDLDKADLVAYSHGGYFTLGDKMGTFGYSVRKKRRKKR